MCVLVLLASTERATARGQRVRLVGRRWGCATWRSRGACACQRGCGVVAMVCRRGNARAKGIGWRLDYCLVTEALRERVHDAWVKLSVEGSDHLPTGVTLLGSLLA